jgi:hypothetical protein
MAPGFGVSPVGTPCFFAFLIHSLAFHRQVTFLYFATKQVQFHHTKYRQPLATLRSREYPP